MQCCQEGSFWMEGWDFTKQVASQTERTSQVGAPVMSRREGGWEVLLERAQWGKHTWHMGSRVAGERRGGRGALLGLDGGRLGQARGRPQWVVGPLLTGGKKADVRLLGPCHFGFS